MLRLTCWPLAFTLYKGFLKNKRRSGNSFSTLFLAWCFKKKIYIVLFTDKILLPDCFYFLIYCVIGVCIVIICCPVCDVINFKINRNFLIKPFFYVTKKSVQKCKISRTKRAFSIKWKAFFTIFNLLMPGGNKKIIHT